MHELKKEIYKHGFNMYSFQECSGIARETLYKFFEGKTKKLRGDTVALISQALNKTYEETERLCKNDKT